jgi:alpha-tubulin suppressor-like RCC1 family protein
LICYPSDKTQSIKSKITGLYKYRNVQSALNEPEKAENHKIVKSFELYSWGTNDTYAEGIHDFCHDVPKRMQFLEAESSQFFDPTSISHVEVNKEYSVALTEDGKVFTWGMGEKGHLGNGDVDFRHAPGQVVFAHYKQLENKSKKITEFDLEYEKIEDAKKKIQKFGSEDDLMEMHKFLQGFMKNKNNKYDRKTSSDCTPEGRERRFSEEDFFGAESYEEEMPSEVANYEQVKLISQDILSSNVILNSISKVLVTQISCSDNHTLVCTNTGSVYGWGSNEYSQLGFENKGNKSSYITCPKKIFGSIKKTFIERVAAGEHHSLALSNDNVAHGWGSNAESQLGFNKSDSLVVYKAVQLQCVTTFSNTKKRGIRIIRASGNHTLLLTESLKCFVSDSKSTSFVQINLESGYVSN